MYSISCWFLNFHLWDSQSESFFARSLQEALRWWWSRGRESLHLVMEFLFQNWSLSVKLSDNLHHLLLPDCYPALPKRKSSSLREISAVGSRKWIAGSWICRKSCWKTARGECWIPMPSCSHDLNGGNPWLFDCLYLAKDRHIRISKNWIWVVFAVPKKGCAICVFHWHKKSGVCHLRPISRPSKVHYAGDPLEAVGVYATNESPRAIALHNDIKVLSLWWIFGCQFAIEPKGRCLMMFSARWQSLCCPRYPLARPPVSMATTNLLDRPSTTEIFAGSSSDSTWLAFVKGVPFDWGWRVSCDRLRVLTNLN